MTPRAIAAAARRSAGVALVAALAACSSDFDPPFLDYRDCVAKTAAEHARKGVPRIKADLDAREYCRKLYGLRQ